MALIAVTAHKVPPPASLESSKLHRGKANQLLTLPGVGNIVMVIIEVRDSEKSTMVRRFTVGQTEVCLRSEQYSPSTSTKRLGAVNKLSKTVATAETATAVGVLLWCLPALSIQAASELHHLAAFTFLVLHKSAEH